MHFFIFTGFLFALFFNACSSFVITPIAVAGYNNGIAIIQKEDQASRVQVEIGQDVIEGFEGAPLLIYIAVQNLHEEKIEFTPDNIQLFMNEKRIRPYSFDSLMRFNINLNSLSYYGIETINPIMPVPTMNPFFPAKVYYPYVVPTPLHGGFIMRYKFSDYSFARASAYINHVKNFNARRFLLMHYLRKNTLNFNDVKGGFLAIPFRHLKEGNLFIRICINGIEYVVTVQLHKK